MSDSAALVTALAYFEAWTGKDFDRAMRFLSDDIEALTPGGPVFGAAAFRQFMEPFSRSLVRAELRAAFGDDDTALVMYDTDTQLLDDAPGAEHVTVVDGRINRMRIIFDRAPFIEARQRAVTG